MQDMQRLSASVDQMQEEISEVVNSHGVEGITKPFHSHLLLCY